MDEHWTSHADEVDAGEDFRDDCDGFALTCAELLMRAGYSKKDVMIIYCTTETGEQHLVCGVNEDDTTYILDNRYDRIYKYTNVPGYTWKYSMHFDRPGIWLIAEKNKT